MQYFKHIKPAIIPSDHPVGKFKQLWDDMSGGEALVPWAKFAPMDVPDILPWILLLEKQTDYKYYYRLCGSECDKMFGETFQGKYLGDGMSVGAADKRFAEFISVERGNGPLFSQNTLPIQDKKYREVYRGVFGFKDEDNQLNKIIVVIAPL